MFSTQSDNCTPIVHISDIISLFPVDLEEAKSGISGNGFKTQETNTRSLFSFYYIGIISICLSFVVHLLICHLGKVIDISYMSNALVKGDITLYHAIPTFKYPERNDFRENTLVKRRKCW